MKLRQLLVPARACLADAPHSDRTGATSAVAFAALAADRERASAIRRAAQSFFEPGFAAAQSSVPAQRGSGRFCVELGDGARAELEPRMDSRLRDFPPDLQPHVEINPVATAA
jgi:hypothetical protein